MAEYKPTKVWESLEKDLDSLTVAESFILGYELATLDCNLNSIRGPFSQHIHAINAGRVEKACKDSGRTHRLSWMENDKTETWMWLDVGPRKR